MHDLGEGDELDPDGAHRLLGVEVAERLVARIHRREDQVVDPLVAAQRRGDRAGVQQVDVHPTGTGADRARHLRGALGAAPRDGDGRAQRGRRLRERQAEPRRAADDEDVLSNRNMTDQDLLSVYAYLSAIPSVP